MRIKTDDGKISQGIRPLIVTGAGGVTTAQDEQFAQDVLTVTATGVRTITSTDNSITVTAPTGPTTNLSVNFPAASAADARHYGYLNFEIFRPASPFDTVVYEDLHTIVGTKANSVTTGNLYNVGCTWQVNANDYLSWFFWNQSGATRTAATGIVRVQDAAGNTEVAGSSSAPTNVSNGAGINMDFAHTSGSTLLDYTTPTKPFFVAGGVYNVQVAATLSFWT